MRSVMNWKEIITYCGSVVLALGAFALVQQKIISWEVASAFVVALLYPSPAHVGLQRLMKDGDQ